jgi:mono/diheme cytochrome c family protein
LKIRNPVLCTVCILLMLVDLPLAAVVLRVDAGGGPRRFEAADLLARPEVQDITISADVAYHRPMRYRALPVAALLAGVAPEAHVQVVADDGFVAEMDAAPLLRNDGPRAWLAIEDPAHPWPPLGAGKPGAGPFYLVWTDIGRARISPEQWPYRIAAIRVIAPLDERFPKLLPDPALSADDPVRRGFAVFRSHCLACHTLNGEGAAQLGPDLNLPHSPTEYLRAEYLRAYIRDPQSLRHWPQAKMPGFDAETLPDADLDALLEYLRHMAARRQADRDARMIGFPCSSSRRKPGSILDLVTLDAGSRLSPG